MEYYLSLAKKRILYVEIMPNKRCAKCEVIWNIEIHSIRKWWFQGQWENCGKAVKGKWNEPLRLVLWMFGSEMVVLFWSWGNFTKWDFSRGRKFLGAGVALCIIASHLLATLSLDICRAWIRQLFVSHISLPPWCFSHPHGGID